VVNAGGTLPRTFAEEMSRMLQALAIHSPPVVQKARIARTEYWKRLQSVVESC